MCVGGVKDKKKRDPGDSSGRQLPGRSRPPPYLHIYILDFVILSRRQSFPRLGAAEMTFLFDRRNPNGRDIYIYIYTLINRLS